jgi:hypothetical protein
VNAGFVAVWVNVRMEPVPDVACLGEVLGGVGLDADRHVEGAFNRGFFLRSVVLAEDGETLLNPQLGEASIGQLLSNGYFAYAQVKAKDYLEMLRGALARRVPAGAPAPSGIDARSPDPR